MEVIRDKDYLIFVDVDSIEMRTELNHKYIVAWTKWICRGEAAEEKAKEYGQPVDYIMMFDAYNIERKQTQILSFHIYNIKKRIINSDSREFRVSLYEEVIPETLGWTIYNFVMSQYKKK